MRKRVSSAFKWLLGYGRAVLGSGLLLVLGAILYLLQTEKTPLAEFNRQIAVAVGAIGIVYLYTSYVWSQIVGRDADQKYILDKLSKLDVIERQLTKHETMLAAILNEVRKSTDPNDAHVVEATVMEQSNLQDVAKQIKGT